MNINAKHSNLLQAGEGYNRLHFQESKNTYDKGRQTENVHEQTCNVQHTKQLNICTFPILQEHQHWGLTLCCGSSGIRNCWARYVTELQSSFPTAKNLGEQNICREHYLCPRPTPAPKVPAFQILVHELLESNLSPEKEVRWDEKEMYLHISIFNDISTGAGWVV